MAKRLPEAEVDTSQLASRLRIANAHLTRRLRRQAAAGEQPASVLSALAVLNRFGPTTLGELAEAEGVSRPTMTVLAAGLEREGLVSREVDREDRRVARLSISPRGREVLAASRSRKNAYLARRLRRLVAADLQVLESAVGVLERLLEEDA